MFSKTKQLKSKYIRKSQWLIIIYILAQKTVFKSCSVNAFLQNAISCINTLFTCFHFFLLTSYAEVFFSFQTLNYEIAIFISVASRFCMFVLNKNRSKRMQKKGLFYVGISSVAGSRTSTNFFSLMWPYCVTRIGTALYREVSLFPFQKIVLWVTCSVQKL